MNHNLVYDKAIENGCKPVWFDGILGPAWHCNCDERGVTHFIDQQCSVVKFYKEVK
jgi:hypothetical protein